MAPSNGELISLSQAAHRLRTTTAALRKQAEDGTFPGEAAVNIGGTWKVVVAKMEKALGLGSERPIADTVRLTPDTTVEDRLESLEQAVIALVAKIERLEQRLERRY